ncbi:hypothetical protein GvMRE_IIg236 [endosymbiont GvMRE of Glomus versiforme]|nr:hypothetical protein GvMRE_IIg236 [endosymbiont GvMRE of Glomus versiforme]
MNLSNDLNSSDFWRDIYLAKIEEILEDIWVTSKIGNKHDLEIKLISS